MPIQANQVVLYFDSQDDALRFTLAASSVMSAEACETGIAGVNAATEIGKAIRITTEGVLPVR